MRILIVLVFLFVGGTAHAQGLPWAMGNAKGWFVATKLDAAGNKLIITCDAAAQERAAILYLPKIPVWGSGQLEVSLGLDGTVVPAGAWQIFQGGVAAKDYASVVDLVEKIRDAFLIDVHLANQPGATFDNFGFAEVSRGLAQACGR
ncbi:hypothetical protein FBZ84_1407 [Azospirillum baldaniorum]|uniref:hypothetical protein n=1 Tax=Azospirillum baldaniorum TaxID=1064539 RepID=UPI00119CC40A|nr:hypothetical protein [Azospirillum baldaniorum]TWA52112.1 hypothetical protein FBZ84_1407 [Azospirillum baldaniorum]